MTGLLQVKMARCLRTEEEIERFLQVIKEKNITNNQL